MKIATFCKDFSELCKCTGQMPFMLNETKPSDVELCVFHVIQDAVRLKLPKAVCGYNCVAGSFSVTLKGYKLCELVYDVAVTVRIYLATDGCNYTVPQIFQVEEVVDVVRKFIQQILNTATAAYWS
jgi:hypothetical protein